MMYFQIENTPEHVRRARRAVAVPKESPKEESPRLILAPFSRPPQVVFDNVLIGATCERNLEVFNPSKQPQQITLGKSLPPGLVIELPGEWLQLEPETCYCVTLLWTPTQPTAIRETIRFTNENRGRYDVIVVLKSVMNIKGKGKPKGFKTSPGKMKKKTGKKSPVAIYKKKSEIIYNTTQITKTYNVIQSQKKYSQVSNKENMSMTDYSIQSRVSKCPFDSPSSVDLNFDTSEVFSNMRRPDILQQTYDKTYTGNDMLNAAQNILKPSNRQTCEISATELFDNLTFTPLKTAPSKTEKLDKGPKIILSVNSESDFDDSLDMKHIGNKENQTHSIISITSSQPPNNWLTVNHHAQFESQVETPTVLVKKHPNTSSPKELNSPNFSINTEFSRISDLSFFPQRFSTERKCFQKINNETQDLLEDPVKLSSDTYTKDSPNTPIEPNFNQMYDMRPPHFFIKDQPKMCRQALFREYQHQKEAFEQKNLLNPYEHNVWHNDLRIDTRSPPRSITPPLQSIPEESAQYSDTHVLDRTDKHKNTFTINRTFDKSTTDHFTFAHPNRQSWSKKAIRAEPDLWKVPVAHVKKAVKNKQQSVKNKDSIGSKMSNSIFETSKSSIQNMTVNQIGNVYSQSSTVDPFVSSTYFYDEEAVEKFETEFKRWLNCILTPPADLESNIEQKIDVGKAWIENRNKDVPVAPTKEQVSSAYHNSHRLESLRRSARALLMSSDISQVFQKLALQIEKKLIAIRPDRNLHLDVGLQKIIMELLLSYNPLWLRIGLEAIYGLVLPLKSNSDIEGLTTFIIQRMFKNPFLKNKHSKTNAPNMLLPAYMEAIKKFTLKKFFMLVYFLDQAKQRKLISHDPCLFCRNAVCKESREIIIRFTRELIAGIGDITKHLRPLGYVVSHKQSYLDEYKYAVHNIALDIRDGVRLVKVMEIILMKDGLLSQLRTPAISRLQKIHNVQVALNALKEANFVIHGDITATDIADGHREKTLSLLWQIIHVFRAPLFEKAANIIQTWWRKKYEVIVEKRKEEERILQEQNNAASLIQCWWRRIQYNRLVEWKMQQITTATIIVQKYCRMWLCRSRLLRYKRSVLKIEKWYKSVKKMREAKLILEKLRLERYELRRKSAIVIQSYIRRWLCVKQYRLNRAAIVLQRRYRALIAMRKERNTYLAIKTATMTIQRRYRARCLMLKNRQSYIRIVKSCITIQRSFRAYVCGKRQRQYYINIKKSVLKIQQWYRRVKLMQEAKLELEKLRSERHELRRKSAVLLQSYVRRWLCVRLYKSLKLNRSVTIVQRRFRALIAMRKERAAYLAIKTAATTIQRRYRARSLMIKERQSYLQIVKSTITIQRAFRAYACGKRQRQEYNSIRKSVLKIQEWYRSVIKMREAKLNLENLRLERYKLRNKSAILIQSYIRRWLCMKKYRLNRSATVVQRRYRALVAMRKERTTYLAMKAAAIVIQRRYRARCLMLKQRRSYLQIVKSCVVIQGALRAYICCKRQRLEYINIKRSALRIQRWFRAVKLMEEAKLTLERLRLERHELRRKSAVLIQCYVRRWLSIRKYKYLKLERSVVNVQRRYRALVAMRKQRTTYLTIKNAAINIQRRYRARCLMLKERYTYLQIVKSCVTIQRMFRAYICGKHQKQEYHKIRAAIILIQRRYRIVKEMQNIQNEYQKLRNAVIFVQQRYRAKRTVRALRHNKAAKKIQNWYTATKKRNLCRQEFLTLKKTVTYVQSMIRMRIMRKRFIAIRNATLIVQRYYRAYLLTIEKRRRYLQIRNSIITLQSYVRSFIARKRFCKLRYAAVTIQAAYRLKKKRELMQQRRNAAAICLQKYARRFIVRSRYLRYVEKVLYVQRIWRGKLVTRLMRYEFLQKKTFIIKLQSIARGYLVRKYIQAKKEDIRKVKEEQRRNWAASKIQALFRGHIARENVAHDKRVAELRQRWRDGGLKSSQESMKERNEEAMEVLRNISGIETVIKAFRSLELLTEVFPMMYNDNASAIVHRVYTYMSVTNRSISSIEVLKSATAVLVNLTRYKVTGPKIYLRDRIPPILKFMWRFSNSETQLFCIMATYLWLFSKYENIRKDLTELLNMPENHKMLITIKGNVDRTKRMTTKIMKNKFNTPQPTKFISHTNNQSMNMSLCSIGNNSIVLPALEPDYGIVRVDKPRYFEDAQQAIACLFHTYKL